MVSRDVCGPHDFGGPPGTRWVRAGDAACSVPPGPRNPPYRTPPSVHRAGRVGGAPTSLSPHQTRAPAAGPGQPAVSEPTTSSSSSAACCPRGAGPGILVPSATTFFNTVCCRQWCLNPLGAPECGGARVPRQMANGLHPLADSSGRPWLSHSRCLCVHPWDPPGGPSADQEPAAEVSPSRPDPPTPARLLPRQGPVAPTCRPTRWPRPARPRPGWTPWPWSRAPSGPAAASRPRCSGRPRPAARAPAGRCCARPGADCSP